MKQRPSQPFTAVAWNILYHTKNDPNVPSQAGRLENVFNADGEVATSGIINTLETRFPEGIDIGVLMEVEGNHGQQISETLGYGSGAWGQHSRKGEYIGMFGRMVDPDKVTFHDIGYRKKAVMTKISGVAFVGVHMKRPHNLQHLREQNEQADALAALIEGEEKVVVMMDANSFPWQYPRRLLGRHGLRSVYTQTGQHPPAFPADTYRYTIPEFEYWTTRILGRHFTIDDIQTKGISIFDAGSHEGLSDHRILYTRGRLD
ncbi:MAG: hypothetical protein ACSLEY_01890 [Candidatus Saccharimonadales bacterium]